MLFRTNEKKWRGKKLESICCAIRSSVQNWNCAQNSYDAAERWAFMHDDVDAIVYASRLPSVTDPTETITCCFRCSRVSLFIYISNVSILRVPYDCS